MSTTLNNLRNHSRSGQDRKRVGRGTGSKVGKTCGRGTKGQGARSGYKRRLGNEGGNCPLFRKLPTRGFTRGRWAKESDIVNLGDIERLFESGETVNPTTLREKGFLSGPKRRLKVLGFGELNKKVTVEADGFSASAKERIEAAGGSCNAVEKTSK